MNSLEQQNISLAIKGAMSEAAAAAQAAVAAVGGFISIREDIDVPESVVITEMDDKEIEKAISTAKNKKVGRSVSALLRMKK